MTSGRLLFAWVSALAIVCGACSTETSGSSPGSGGKPGQGGSTGTGGTAGAGTGGTVSGTGGATSGTGGKGSGGTNGSGGATTGTGGSGSGGAAPGTGGRGSGGASPSTGGRTGEGGSGSGGTAVGGRTGTGGVDGGMPGTGGKGTGGTTGTAGTSGGGTSGGGGYAPGNPAVPSEGCGKALPSTYKAGANTTRKDITSASLSREYIIYIPSNYDSSKPYKLLFAWHPMGGSDSGTAGSYYGLKAQDTGGTTIFVAPQGYSDSSPWRIGDDKDHIFFDDMLKLFKADLCIDVSRVFATGFSYGGMETYSLSVNRQQYLRAAVGIAPANWNIYVTKTKTHLPIAWMQTTGMSDGTCPWVQGSSTTNGAKYIAIEHATDNGCTSPSTMTTWQSGAHVCFDYAGCKAGYPTKICTFNGGHTDNNSDSGGTNWIPQESWKFFTQF